MKIFLLLLQSVSIIRAEIFKTKPPGWNNVPEPNKLHYNDTETNINDYTFIKLSFLERERAIWPELNLYTGIEIDKPNYKNVSEFGRLSTYLRYPDLIKEGVPISSREIERLNGWIQMAEKLYSGSNKPEVVKAFSKLEVISSDTIKNQSDLRLASVCEVEKANNLSEGTLAKVLYRFWSQDNHITFWNYTEMAIYDLADGWWDCRNQSGEVEKEIEKQINSTMVFIYEVEECGEKVVETDKSELQTLTSNIKQSCLQMYQLLKHGRQDYDKLLKEIEENNGTDPMAQNMSKPFDPNDYPSVDITYDKELVDIFHPNMTASCTEFNSSISGVAEVQKVSKLEGLKDVITKLEELEKAKLNEFALRLMFPENPKNGKTTPTGCGEIQRKAGKISPFEDGHEIDIRFKIITHGPRNGEWGSWSEWSECSLTCAAAKSTFGVQKRSRKCDSPPPSGGGYSCGMDALAKKQGLQTEGCDSDSIEASKDSSMDSQQQKCFQTIKCNPVDGGWSPWYMWSDCSKTCGDGFRITRRYCDTPRPSQAPKGKSCRKIKQKEDLVSDTESILPEDKDVEYEEMQESCSLDDCKKATYENAFERSPEADKKRKEFHKKFSTCSKLIKDWTEEKFQNCLEYLESRNPDEISTEPPEF